MTPQRGEIWCANLELMQEDVSGQNYCCHYRLAPYDDGSLWQVFVASVRHLAAEKHLDLRVLHGDGTNTVAKKGVMGLATRGTNTRRARKSSPSSTTMATS